MRVSEMGMCVCLLVCVCVFLCVCVCVCLLSSSNLLLWSFLRSFSSRTFSLSRVFFSSNAGSLSQFITAVCSIWSESSCLLLWAFFNCTYIHTKSRGTKRHLLVVVVHINLSNIYFWKPVFLPKGIHIMSCGSI